MASYEAGLYENVQIVGQGFCKSKEKKTPGFYLTIKPGEYERQITWWLPEGKEDAIDRLFAGLESLGFEGTRFADLDPDNKGFFDFSRFAITCECKHQPATDGSGKVYEQWQLPFAGSRDITPLEPTEVRRLDTLFGKAMKQRFGGQRAATTPEATKAPMVGGPLTPEAKATLQKAKATTAEPDEPMEVDDGIPF